MANSRTLTINIVGDDRSFARSVRNVEQGSKRMGDSFGKTDEHAQRLGKSMRGLFETTAKVGSLGVAAQGISAIGAAAGAAASGLAPLTGALAAVPALYSAAGQASVVFKLATSNITTAIGGLNETLDKNTKAFKALDPQAKKLAIRLDELKKPIRELSSVAQRGLFPGVEDGIVRLSKLMPLARSVTKDTAEAMGDFAREAGGVLATWGPDLEKQGQRNVRWMRDAGQVAISLGTALKDVTLAAGPLTNWLANNAVKLADFVENATTAARKSGGLGDFFHETEIAISRVARIAGDLGSVLVNVGRIAYETIGKRLMGDLTRAADEFRKWSESAKGQNAIRKFFLDAEPAIREVAKLAKSITVAFFELGRGDQVAPLLRTIRTELLPAIQAMVAGTTKEFMPAFIDLAVQSIKLFTQLGGTSGPLVQFTKLLGTVVGGFNTLLDKFPVLQNVLVTMLAAGGIARALRLTAAITGMSTLIGMLKTARGIGATTAATGAVGGKAGAAGKIGTAGRVANAVPLVGVAIGAAVVAIESQHSKESKSVDDLEKSLGRLYDTRRRLVRQGRIGEAMQLDKDKNAAYKNSESWDDLRDSLRKLASQADRTSKSVSADFKDVARNTRNNWNRVKEDTDTTWPDIRKQITSNSRMIKARLGDDSAEGRKALASNFRQARSAIREAMRDGTVATRKGMREIRKLLVDELKAFGISPGAALSIVKHGDIKGENQDPRSGKQRGGWVNRAAGGWIGGRGMVSGDVVPLEPGVMAGYGEFYAKGPGGRGAILNRHQIPVVEAMVGGRVEGLGANALPRIEAAMAPVGGLDQLFAAIQQPHMFARGGIVPVPGFPGESANRSVIGKILAIAKRFNLTLTDAYGQGHKSPGHTQTGTAADFAGPDRSMDAAVRYLVGQGYLVGYDGRFGSQAWPGHGPVSAAGSNAHLHVELGGKGGNIAGAISKIIAPTVRGGGALGRGVQGALRMAAAGANRYAERKAASAMATPVGGGGGGAAPPGQVRTWLAAGLRLAGQAASAGNINTLYGRVMQESRGNPRAINNWDSNARAGHPSKGILQTIDSTFNRYKVRGHGNIFNPVDNIAAAVRYMLATYGRLVGRSSTGYARGGRVGGAVRRFAGGGDFNVGLGIAQLGAGQPLGTAPTVKVGAPLLSGSQSHGYALDVARAQRGQAVAKAKDNLASLIDALVKEVRLKRKRRKLVRKVLRGRITAARRQRLVEEEGQLAGEIGDLNATIKEYRADAAGGATTVTRADELEGGVDPSAEGPPTAEDFINAQLAQAGLTADLGDDLAAAQAMLGLRQGEYGAAVAGGDPRRIAEAASNLKSAMDAVASLDEATRLATETQQRLTDALTGLQTEMARQNQIYESVIGVSSREAIRALADTISGQIVGVGLQGRRQTAGTGTVALMP